MYGCKSWTIKKAECWRTVVLEKTLKSSLDSKEIQPVDPKANQSWIVIGSIDVEAEAVIFSLLDVKSWLIGKVPDGGKDWRQEEKGTTEDEMAGWPHRHNGHEFEQAPGVGNGQGGLVCCSPRGCKESDTTEQLDWTEATRLGITGELGVPLRCSRIVSTRGIESVLNLRLPMFLNKLRVLTGMGPQQDLRLMANMNNRGSRDELEKWKLRLRLYSNPVKRTFLLCKNNLEQHPEVYTYLQFHFKFSFRESVIKY